jgi:phosphoribosylformylglycinamidine (FGAM) synthase-like amidotransferase family enzyme
MNGKSNGGVQIQMALVENIAGICNETRNVFGMMPHPERASEEDLGNIGWFDFVPVVG